MTEGPMRPGPPDPTAAEMEAATKLTGIIRPTPREEVRNTARIAFLTGKLPGHEAKNKLPSDETRPRRIKWARWLLPTLTASAAIAVVVIGRSPENPWRISDVKGPQGITLGGQSIAGETVSPGVVTTRDTSEVQIDLGDNLRIRLVPGTRIILPDAPGRWFGRDPELRIEAGELYGVSKGTLGFRLHIVTPEAVAIVTGTSFAAIRNDESTCFCLYYGALSITSLREGGISLPERSRVFIYRDGRPHRVEPITPMEVMKLEMIQSSMNER